jgi:signal transduction histidine kinase
MAGAPQEELVLFIIFGTIGILGLTSIIFLFFLIYQRRLLALQQKEKAMEIKFQNDMIALQLASVEEERKRIASDLHDSISNHLAGARIQAKYLERVGSFEPKEIKSVTMLLASLDEAIVTTRRIAWELTPETFRYSGLSASIAKMCERFHGKELSVKFIETGLYLWHDDRALMVYRIVQELITNCVKHANATLLTLELTWLPGQLTICATDNGKGFNLSEVQRGVGWWGIQQRVRQLEAEISIGVTPMGTGAQINLTIPLPHEESTAHISG